MPIDTRPSDLVFDQFFKPFKGRKKLSRGYGRWAIFLWKFQRGGGLTFPSENGNSEEVGGSYLKFPPWYGSGYFLELHIGEKFHQLLGIRLSPSRVRVDFSCAKRIILSCSQ